jgi:hypothetical protein
MPTSIFSGAGECQTGYADTKPTWRIAITLVVSYFFNAFINRSIETSNSGVVKLM